MFCKTYIFYDKYNKKSKETNYYVHPQFFFIPFKLFVGLCDTSSNMHGGQVQ